MRICIKGLHRGVVKLDTFQSSGIENCYINERVEEKSEVYLRSS